MDQPLEKSLAITQKCNIELSCDPVILLLGTYSINEHKYSYNYIHFHSYSVCNSQEVETMQISINGRRAKKCGIFI